MGRTRRPRGGPSSPFLTCACPPARRMGAVCRTPRQEDHTTGRAGPRTPPRPQRPGAPRDWRPTRCGCDTEHARRWAHRAARETARPTPRTRVAHGTGVPPRHATAPHAEAPAPRTPSDSGHAGRSMGHGLDHGPRPTQHGGWAPAWGGPARATGPPGQGREACTRWRVSRDGRPVWRGDVLPGAGTLPPLETSDPGTGAPPARPPACAASGPAGGQVPGSHTGHQTVWLQATASGPVAPSEGLGATVRPPQPASWVFSPGAAPNATLQARGIAEARNERRLFPVACKRLLGAVSG